MFAQTTSRALLIFCVLTHSALAADWSEDQIPRLPTGETPVRLFNGKDFTGWEGQIGKYFFIENGVIVGRNTADNAPRASSYLLTKEKYRDFRLIVEGRLVTSEMHTGVAFWGRQAESRGEPFNYEGQVVMYPSAYGIYDLYHRRHSFRDTLGAGQRAGKQHDWNRMEIVARGRRIRHVVNGQLVADWSDPQPALTEPGPIGLQLRFNTVPQEVQFRGLILTTNPQDRLVTAENRDAGLIVDSTPSDSGMDADALKKIAPWMRELVEAKQLAGGVALVARRGRVVYHEAVGKADITAGRDMARDTLFAIASMTKPITAAAVMILNDERKLQLDDPVSKYIPAFRDTATANGKPTREITVRDCLRHTSGLSSDQRNQGTLENTVDLLAKSPLEFEPGSNWKYGPGLSVAGRIVEIVSGKRFDQFLAERVFVPLEMKDTTFRPTPAQAARLARLYQPTADKKDIEPAAHYLYDFTADTSPSPSGGLFSTAGDLIRFHQMMLNGGALDGKRILSNDSVRQMTTIQTEGIATGMLPGDAWGLGFVVIREPQGTTRHVSPGSFGHSGAFETQGWIDPQREMVFILLVQRQGFRRGEGDPNLRREFQGLAVEAVRDGG